MNIDKKKLKLGIWYTDEKGNVIPNPDSCLKPDGAEYVRVCWPLEIREELYKLREDGHYGGDDHIATFCTHLGKASGRLAVAMVNSGEYELDEALAVLNTACERCVNVLWNKYLPEEDGYPELSPEWFKANTVCEFCRDMGG